MLARLHPEPYDLRGREEDEIDRLARTDGSEPDPHMPPEVQAEIQRIEPAAAALGWRSGRLWSRSYWPNTSRHPRGLASLLDLGDRLVEVAANYIVIEKADGNKQRFWKTDAGAGERPLAVESRRAFRHPSKS
ncbi:MAG: hypothetical protein ACLQU2_01720 [Candidatus Binataceae bacterium]